MISQWRPVCRVCFMVCGPNEYSGEPAGSATLRYGFSDHLTLESHAEATNNLANGGIGANLGLDGIGVVSTAFSGSTNNGPAGGQAYASFNTSLFRFSLSASTVRTFGGYNDL
jgi:outer membrane usher protein